MRKMFARLMARQITRHLRSDLLVTVESGEEALQSAALFFQYYRENANYLERSYDFVERLGIERVRRETIYAPLAVQQGLRERLRKSKAISKDAWLEGDQPRHPAQFVQIQPLENISSERLQ
jgi:nitrite reductase (NADH) large subunit